MDANAAGHVVVFAGPTIQKREIEEILPAIVRGPVRRGDVYVATLDRPNAIAIVDGYFDQTPASWHKEVLWALTLGIRVYGSSSMGALRAAELSTFGMTGIGQIYDDLQNGKITADDEVAVAHRAEDEEFRPLSDALVNIRSTLRAAERCGVLSRAIGAALEEIARRLFFPERSYARVLEEARALSLDRGELTAFEAWLSSGRIDQKRIDAKRMLEAIRAALPMEATPPASFSFQQTDAWLRLRAALDTERARQARSPDYVAASTSETSPIVRSWAVLRAIAMTEARTRQTVLSRADIDHAVEEFRREHGLESVADFGQWIERTFKNEESLKTFFGEEALLRALCRRHEAQAEKHLLHALIAYHSTQRDR